MGKGKNTGEREVLLETMLEEEEIAREESNPFEAWSETYLETNPGIKPKTEAEKEFIYRLSKISPYKLQVLAEGAGIKFEGEPELDQIKQALLIKFRKRQA